MIDTMVGSIDFAKSRRLRNVSLHALANGLAGEFQEITIIGARFYELTGKFPDP